MSLVFAVAPPPAAPDVQRADVACFVGFVARRAGQPVPAALQSQPQAAGLERRRLGEGRGRAQTSTRC